MYKNQCYFYKLAMERSENKITLFTTTSKRMKRSGINVTK